MGIRTSRPTTDFAARDSYPDRLVDAEGRRLCVNHGCGALLKGRQERWCSKLCGATAYATWDYRAARDLVLKRDKGVCAHCGLDCIWLRDVLSSYNSLLRMFHSIKNGMERGCAVLADKDAEALYQLLGLPRRRGSNDDIWQADHIVPLAEGGKLCDLSNLRTLCVSCHKKETAALARRIALRRRVA